MGAERCFRSGNDKQLLEKLTEELICPEETLQDLKAEEPKSKSSYGGWRDSSEGSAGFHPKPQGPQSTLLGHSLCSPLEHGPKTEMKANCGCGKNDSMDWSTSMVLGSIPSTAWSLEHCREQLLPAPTYLCSLESKKKKK